MIWLVVACATKSQPVVQESNPPIEIIIADNTWSEDGLQVAVGIRAVYGAPQLERVIIQTSTNQFPFFYGARPLNSDWLNVEFIVPLEEVPGQFIQGSVFLKQLSKPYEFSLVSPFPHEDAHDEHDEH